MRFPGINFLKALAALFIMWGHTSQECFGQWQGGVHALPVPAECVTLFFLISGFLASINAKDFSSWKEILNYYQKRAKRLFPLYYTYICIAILAFALINRNGEIINHRLWFYLFPAGEIPFSCGTGILPLVHLWYIGAITLLFIIFPFFSRIEESRKISTSLAIFIGWNAIKILLYFVFGKGIAYRMIGVIRADSFFLGVAVALLLKRDTSGLIKFTGSIAIQVIAWGMFLLSGLYDSHIPAPTRNPFFSIAYCLLLLSMVSKRADFISRYRVIDYLGQISYGIYVWHPLVIILLAELVRIFGISPESITANFLIYLTVSFISIGIAGFTHRYIEEPAVKRQYNGLHTKKI